MGEPVCSNRWMVSRSASAVASSSASLLICCLWKAAMVSSNEAGRGMLPMGSVGIVIIAIGGEHIVLTFGGISINRLISRCGCAWDRVWDWMDATLPVGFFIG